MKQRQIKSDFQELPQIIIIKISELYPDSEAPSYLKTYLDPKGNPVNIKIDRAAIDSVDHSGLNLLHHAAKAGDSALVKFLLDQGANVNKITDYPRSFAESNVTALDLVISELNKLSSSNNLKQAQDLLIDYGADIGAIGVDLQKKYQELSAEQKEEITRGEAKKREKKEQANQKLIKDCAEGDKALEQVYADFYKFLQANLTNSIGAIKSLASGMVPFDDSTSTTIITFTSEKILGQIPFVGDLLGTITSAAYKEFFANPRELENFRQQANYFANSKDTDVVIEDYAARVTEYYKEDIITPDLDAGHKIDQKGKEKILDSAKHSLLAKVTGISRAEIAAHYQKEGDGFIPPHWQQIVGIAVLKFFDYLKNHNINYREELGIKVAEEFLPSFQESPLNLTLLEQPIFDLETAKSLAQVAQLSYTSKEKIKSMIKVWGFDTKELAPQYYVRQSDLFKSVIMHDNEKLIIAFRGAYHNKNWLDDINIISKTITVRNETLKVHQGFYEALMTHWQNSSENERPLKEIIEEILTQYPNLKIYISGHSLGGAMAAQAYLQLANMEINGQQLDLHQIALYTYGQPLWCKAGSEITAKALFPGNYHRIVNYEDPVPSLPAENMGYQHVGQAYYLHKDGTLINQSQYNLFRQSKEISDTLAAKIFYQDNHGMALYHKNLKTCEMKFDPNEQLLAQARLKNQLADMESEGNKDTKHKTEEDPFSKESLAKLKDKLAKRESVKQEKPAKQQEQEKPEETNIGGNNLDPVTKQELNPPQNIVNLPNKNLSESEIKEIYNEIKNDNYTRLKQLLDHELVNLESTDKNGWTLLHKAAWFGDKEKVESLIKDSPELLILNHNSGISSIYLAVFAGHKEITSIFLRESSELIDTLTNSGITLLHGACHGGHAAVVELLLKANPALIDQVDKDGWTVLHYACDGGHAAVVELLLKAKPALIDQVTKNGRTVLHYACRNGHAAVVELLLKAKPALIDQTDKDGQTVLHSACEGGPAAMVELLLEKKPALIDQADEDGETVLHAACLRGHAAMVELLLEKKPALIDQTDKDGQTVLHSACLGGHAAVVELLLKAKPALIDQTDKYGRTVLHYACIWGHAAVVELLLKAKPALIDQVDKNGATVLHSACYNGHEKVVELLLKEKPGLIDMADKYGRTVLHYACIWGQRAVVELLLKAKPALIDQVDKDGATVLHSACEKGHAAVVELLLKAKPGLIDQVNEDGETVLHAACQWGQTAAVELLLEKKPALIDQVSWDGRTVLHYACQEGHAAVVELLLEKKPGLIDQVNQYGGTVLHYACKGGHAAVVELLLKAKPALIDQVAKDGTVLYSACQNGHAAVVELLLKAKPALIDQVDKNGATVLHSACYNGHEKVVELLLKEKPGLIDMAKKDGSTVLHSACIWGHAAVVELLLKAKPALIDQVDKDGSTVLHSACSYKGHEKLVELLVAKGMKIDNLELIDELAEKSTDTSLIAKIYYAVAVQALAKNQKTLFEEALLKAFKIDPYNLSISKLFIEKALHLKQEFIFSEDTASAKIYKDGIKLLLAEKYQDALEIFKTNDTPATAADFALEKAICFLRLAKYTKAEKELEQYALLTTDKKAASYYQAYGELMLEYGNYQQAFDYFNRAIELDKNSAESYLGIGRLYLQIGDLAQGQQCFNKAIKSKLLPESVKEIAEREISPIETKLFIQKQEFKAQTMKHLIEEMHQDLSSVINIDIINAKKWLQANLKSNSLNIEFLQDLNYATKLLSPEGIMPSTLGAISKMLPPEKKPLSIKKATKSIQSNMLYSFHPYFSKINDLKDHLKQLKNQLKEDKTGAISEKAKLHAMEYIGKLLKYYDDYIDQVIEKYGDDYRKKLDDDKKYILELYNGAQNGDLLTVENTGIATEDGYRGYVHPEAESSLSLTPVESSEKFGKHTVAQYGKMHYKHQPYAPGIEFAVSSLYNLILDGITPPARLLKLWNNADPKQQAIYLASKTITGRNLQEVIDDPEKYINKIDLENFSGMLIASLLTSPGDAKPDNFMVTFEKDANDELKSIKFVSIDNDISFCKGKLGVQKIKGQAKIYSDVLNILYFLPQMDNPVSSIIRDKLLASKTMVEQILSTWLQDLYMQNVRFQYLKASGFTDKDLEDMKLPIKLKAGTLVDIYYKLTGIVKLLEEHPYITHSNILKNFYPGISYFYEALREQSHNVFEGIKAAYAAAADNEELAKQLQSRKALESKKAWAEISTSRMMNQESFKTAFDNDITSETESFIAAIDFSRFGLADSAILTILQNNLFFAKNLKLHNINFEQLQQLLLYKNQNGENLCRFNSMQNIKLIDPKMTKDELSALKELPIIGKKLQSNAEDRVTSNASSLKIPEKSSSQNSVRVNKLNINVQDEQGNTALHKAVVNCNILDVQRLLDAGIDDSIKNIENKTAIDLSQEQTERVEIYQLLAEYEPVTLWQALEARNIKEAAVLASTMSLQQIQREMKTALVGTQTKPIDMAVRHEELADVALALVKRGIKLTDKRQGGDNILHIISQYCHKDSTMTLINEIIKHSYGALNQPNNAGFYPTDIAAREGKTNFLVTLINHGYKFATFNHDNSKINPASLEIVSHAGKYGIKIDKNDIEEGYDHSKKNDDKNLLELAAQEGDLNLLKQIKDHPKYQEQLQEENLWDEAGYHKFANDKTKELAKLYHKYGFKVELEEVIKGFNQQKANAVGNSLIYEILKKICITEQDNDTKRIDLESVLEAQNADNQNVIDINYTARENLWLPLHFAVSSGQTKWWIQQLCEHGAKLLKDKFGKTAKDIAQSQVSTNTEILELLNELTDKPKLDQEVLMMGQFNQELSSEYEWAA